MELEFNGFNNRLEDLIKYAGKTHKEIAAETGISKNVIDSYTSKNGSSNPSAENAIRLATVLGTTAEYLMTGKSHLPLYNISQEQRKIMETIFSLSHRDREIVKSLLNTMSRVK